MITNTPVYEFVQKLEAHRVPPEKDSYNGGDRVTHCHLMFYWAEKKEYVKFEVRGWTYSAYNDAINVSVVNWRFGGPATLYVSDNNLTYCKILEDEPTMQVLYK